jgi:hypothetical protein
MIEQFLSRTAWLEAIEQAKANKNVPEALQEGWVQSPVSNDYLEGCTVGMLMFVTALLESKRTDRDYIHWLARKTTTHLIYVLYKRGFNPYGDAGTVPVPSQSQIDEVVKRLFESLEPPAEPPKV